jgi:ATP-dependent Lon protease
LEKIRKCLFEYLAVVRLKELNAEREIAEEQKPVESVALEEATKAEVKPVTPQKRQSNRLR